MGSSTATAGIETDTTKGSGEAVFDASYGGVAGRIGEDGIEGEEARSIMGERGGAKGGGPSESESESEEGTGGGAEMGVWTGEASVSLEEEGRPETASSTTLLSSFLRSRPSGLLRSLFSGWSLRSAGVASSGAFSPLFSEPCSDFPFVSCDES